MSCTKYTRNSTALSLSEQSKAVISIAECSKWIIPVNALEDIENPTRNHAWILPDNSVWVLNHEGTGWVQISGLS